MIDSYKKLLEKENILSLKLDQDKKEISKIRRVLYQNKDLVTNKLIEYLKLKLNFDYYKYTVVDIDNNVADLLVREDSNIFEVNIKNKEYLNFNVEELIDKRMFNNYDEIIIINFNFEGNLIDLEYLCDSLNYYYLSYSEELKKLLENFVDYLLK